MTVIAWDGKTLAADKQFTSAGLRRTGCKLFRLRDGIVGIEGRTSDALSLLAWLRGNREPTNFPESCKGDDAPAVLGIINGTIQYWNGSPYPVTYDEPFTATGSGRDYAIAAMHCGKTAAEAVEIASVYDNGCGMGVDTLDP
jgi:ATP-dependent protease HslVU (ClpYQ) peptidase subunit